jgi:hypothetical protein
MAAHGVKPSAESLASEVSLSPIQMCDALSRNVPKLPAGVEILLTGLSEGAEKLAPFGVWLFVQLHNLRVEALILISLADVCWVQEGFGGCLISVLGSG